MQSLLAVHVVAIVALDSLGAAVAPFVTVENLTYISDPNIVPLIRSLSTGPYFNHCLSHWIFICIALLGLRVEKSWVRPSRETVRPIRSFEFWGYSAFFAGILLSIRYYFFGPGWTVLKETRLIFFSTSEAVTHRVRGYLAAGIGEGNYLASVAAYVFFPLAAALLTIRRKRISWSIFILSGLFSLIYAYQTRQKAPLLWTFLAFFFLFYLASKEERSKNLLKGMFTSAVSIGSVGTILLYMINFGQTFLSSIQGFIFRIFLVPASSEANFFGIFPENIPFRGISGVLNIPWGRISATDTISIMDVARMATGTTYSANASFLAVAWSSSGFLGIVFVSLLLVILIVALDRLYRSAPRRLFYIALALSPVCLISLISDGFSTYVGKGGLIVPFLIVLLTRAPAISFKSKVR